jgi:hypothetical protein
VAPLALGTLLADLLALVHGRHRTAGTGALYEDFRDQLSRRVIRELAELLRREHWHRVAAEQRRITWLTPGLVWSMDDMEMSMAELGLSVADTPKFFWNQVRDLASRYQFEPLTTATLATGEIVAARFRRLFDKYSPPLVIKLDNHGNLNNAWVAAVLGEYLVIPLNSPPYYAPYNGGIERAQHEFQQTLRGKLQGLELGALERAGALNLLQIYSEVVSHDLDHRPRPCLKGATACRHFEVGKGKHRDYYDRNKRREVFAEMQTMAALAMAETGLTDQRAASAAWRLAVETWLRREGHITVSVDGKVLPYYA